MILVANGCSHTAGAEMEYPLQRRCYDKAWPKHLAELLKYDHVNLSDSGASSHRVVRTTMRYVLDNLTNIHDHFFVIAWPGAYRDEFKYSESFTDLEKESFYDDEWLPLVAGNDKHYKSIFTSKIYTVYKAWVLSHSTIKASMDYMTDIIFLQNLLLMFKAKFLFLEASHVNIPKDDPDLAGYSGLIAKKTFPYFGNPNHTLTTLLKNNGQTISEFSIQSGFGSHYDEKAQRWYASYVHSLLPNS